MAKSARQAAEAEAEKPKKSKKTLIIVIVALVLLAGGGAAGWYFTMGGKSASEHDGKPQITYLAQPKFISLEPFTVNLQRETTDQYLQVGMSLKIYNPALEDEIKNAMPEIRSKLLLLLSSKRASELSTVAGKKKLADEIILATDHVLGVKPPASLTAVPAASGVAAASDVAAAAGEAESAGAKTTEPKHENKDGIVDVLFTSFIIQ